MEIKGSIIKINGDLIAFKSFEDVSIDDLKKHEIDGKLFASVEIMDKETITDLQRKHFYALIGDCVEYTGMPADYWEQYFKMLFRQMNNLEELPSLKRNGISKNQAKELLTMIIEFCILKGIPFRKQQFYLTADQSKYLYAMTMNRLCVVCGKEHADIHHARELVGMGRDRRNYNHLNSKYLSLCREHHTECHQTGLLTFEEKYHLTPIQLSGEDIKKLNI